MLNPPLSTTPLLLLPFPFTPLPKSHRASSSLLSFLTSIYLFAKVYPASLSPTSTGTASKWGLVADRLLDLAASFSAVLTRIQVFVRRLLELHIFKLVALYTVWVALKEVSVPAWAVSLSEAGFCWLL